MNDRIKLIADIATKLFTNEYNIDADDEQSNIIAIGFCVKIASQIVNISEQQNLDKK